jgi:hypothetical protein
MLLWIPRVGPLWKYSKRKIDEFDARQPVMQEHEPGQ